MGMVRRESVIQRLAAQGNGAVVGAVYEVIEGGDVADILASASGDNTGGGTLDVIIEDSPDNVNFDTWVTIPQVAGDGASKVQPSTPPARFIRATSTVATGGTYDATIKFDGWIGLKSL